MFPRHGCDPAARRPGGSQRPRPYAGQLRHGPARCASSGRGNAAVPATIDPLDQSLDASTLEDASNGGLEAGVRVADDEPDPVQAAGLQGAQELGPEGLRFGWTNAQSDDLTAPFGVGGHGDHGCDRHDPPALSLLEVCGIEPEIGPLAGQRAVQELADPLVDQELYRQNPDENHPVNPEEVHQHRRVCNQENGWRRRHVGRHSARAASASSSSLRPSTPTVLPTSRSRPWEISPGRADNLSRTDSCCPDADQVVGLETGELAPSNRC